MEFLKCRAVEVAYVVYPPINFQFELQSWDYKRCRISNECSYGAAQEGGIELVPEELPPPKGKKPYEEEDIQRKINET